MALTAAQLFYTRVEPSESPTKRSGFQTVCHSRDRLSDQSIEDAEQYFVSDGKEAKDGRLIFGPLANNSVLLAKISNCDRQDRCGRDGNFFVHALIFDQDEWIVSGLTPTALIERIRFASDLKSGADQASATNWDIPSLQILSDSRECKASDWQRWDLPELVALACLGAGAPYADERRQFTIEGDSDEILRTLHLAYCCVPRPVWPHLSFSIGAACGLRQHHYWAVGATTGKPPTEAADVDARCRRVEVRTKAEIPSYACWLERHVGTNRELPSELEKVAAWQLTSLVDRRERSNAVFPHQRIAAAIWECVPNRCEQRILQNLSGRVGSALCQRVLQQLREDTQPAERFRWMADVSDNEIASPLHAAYRQRSSTPSRDEYKQLEQFAASVTDARPALWLAAWNNDRKTLVGTLRTMAPDVYRELVRDLAVVTNLDLTHLFIPEYGVAFAQAIGQASSTSGRLVPVVRLLLRARQQDALPWLTPQLANCTEEEILALRRMCRGVDVASSFLQRLFAFDWPQQERPKSLFSKFLGDRRR